MREDGDDTVGGTSRAAVDCSDSATRNGRTDDRGVGEVRQEDLAGVTGIPRRLLVSIETRDRLTDNAVQPFNAWRRPRTIARSASATLKAL
jgi:hypothetical protein